MNSISVSNTNPNNQQEPSAELELAPLNGRANIPLSNPLQDEMLEQGIDFPRQDQQMRGQASVAVPRSNIYRLSCADVVADSPVLD